MVENSELTGVGGQASLAWLLTPFDPAAWGRLGWALPRLFASYWGVLGPVSDAFYLPLPFYYALALLAGGALVGLVGYLAGPRGWRARPAAQRWAQALVVLAALALGYAVVARTGQARTANALDGRHLLAVAGALAALLAGGLTRVVPRGAQTAGAGLALAGLLGVALAAPLLYPQTVHLPRADVVAGQPGERAQATWANGISLLSFSADLSQFRPGASLPVKLRWRLEERLREDFQVAFLVVGRDGDGYLLHQSVPLRDVLPPTGWLPGDVITDQPVLLAPPHVPLGKGRLEIYVLEGAAGEAVARVEPGLKPLADLGALDVRAPAVAPGAVARPLGARFGDSLELAGYGPAELKGQAGQPLAVQLFWRALTPPPADYVVSLQLLDAQGKLAAQSDAPPLEGRYPTSHWPQGELVADARALPLPAALAPGEYELRAIVYEHPSLTRLRLPAAQGNADYTVLGKVQVGK
ncbi:MAG: hypothetical protein ACYC4L_20805 [Chloroflexota bacterium]